MTREDLHCLRAFSALGTLDTQEQNPHSPSGRFRPLQCGYAPLALISQDPRRLGSLTTGKAPRHGEPQRQMRKLLTGSYAALLVLLVAAPAVAAQPAPPQYQSSEPSEGAKVHEPPDRVEVTFDQPLDASSTLTVTDECDRRIDDEATEVSGSTMSVALEEGPSGTYRVEYLAEGLGGLTGEEKGQFTFLSHSGTSCGKTTGGGPTHHGNGGGDKGDEGHGGQKAGSHSGTTDHAGNGGSSSHDGTTHTGTSGTSSHGGTHPSGAGSSPGQGSHADGSHAGGKDGGTATGSFDGITSSDTSSGRLPKTTSTMLLVSLFLCAALGVLGGAVLRATRAK